MEVLLAPERKELTVADALPPAQATTACGLRTFYPA